VDTRPREREPISGRRSRVVVALPELAVFATWKWSTAVSTTDSAKALSPNPGREAPPLPPPPSPLNRLDRDWRYSDVDSSFRRWKNWCTCTNSRGIASNNNNPNAVYRNRWWGLNSVGLFQFLFEFISVYRNIRNWKCAAKKWNRGCRQRHLPVLATWNFAWRRLLTLWAVLPKRFFNFVRGAELGGTLEQPRGGQKCQKKNFFSDFEFFA